MSKRPVGGVRDAGRVPTFALVIDAEATAVGEVRREVVEFAAGNGADRWLQQDIALAVSEAATNAVLHAYPGDATGSLRVIADVLDGALEVLIADEGAGLRSGAPSEGLGLGLGLMADLTDAFSIDSGTPCGTEVWLRFLLP
jgi:serine/threonine-protein kinase RsbW